MPVGYLDLMNLYEFNLLYYECLLVIVSDRDTFLARRWEEEDGINLYHLLGDFFVEIYYDTHANKLVRLRSFRSSIPLNDSLGAPYWRGSLWHPSNLVYM